ncbi:MAG: hypothetical protein ACREF8_07535, partial [Chthoniobacterales bacterium]
LCVPDARQLFCRRPALLVPGLPLVLSAPHWFWISAHPGSATENLYRLRMGSGPMGLELPARSTWDGLLSFVITVLFLLTPLLLGCAVALLVSRRTEKLPRKTEPPQLRSLRTLLGWLLLAEVALFIVSIFVGGVFHVHQQYLVALLPPFPLWLALQWRAISQSPAAGTVLFMGLVLAVSLTIARTLSIVAGQNPLAFPYAEIAATISQDSQGPSAVLSDRPEHAANIAIRLPDATICEGPPVSFGVLAVADDAETVAEFGRALAENYRPTSDVRVLQYPWRWNPNRIAKLFLQSWERSDSSLQSRRRARGD